MWENGRENDPLQNASSWPFSGEFVLEIPFPRSNALESRIRSTEVSFGPLKWYVSDEKMESDFQQLVSASICVWYLRLVFFSAFMMTSAP